MKTNTFVSSRPHIQKKIRAENRRIARMRAFKNIGEIILISTFCVGVWAFSWVVAIALGY